MSLLLGVYLTIDAALHIMNDVPRLSNPVTGYHHLYRTVGEIPRAQLTTMGGVICHGSLPSVGGK